MLKLMLAVAVAVFFAMPGGASAQGGNAKTGTAIFAGGCFWCVEADFDHVPGVLTTVSGYTGGRTENPTYEQVSREDTGHREAVRITFDPAKISYEQLVRIFWRTVDPTDAGGQFCDRGVSYETAVFVGDAEQRRIAEASKAQAAADLGQPIVTRIEDAATFYPAEDYHQDYYTKNPLRYRLYRWNCGRNQRVEEVWGDKAYAGIGKEN